MTEFSLILLLTKFPHHAGLPGKWSLNRSLYAYATWQFHVHANSPAENILKILNWQYRQHYLDTDWDKVTMVDSIEL